MATAKKKADPVRELPTTSTETAKCKGIPNKPYIDNSTRFTAWEKFSNKLLVRPDVEIARIFAADNLPAPFTGEYEGVMYADDIHVRGATSDEPGLTVSINKDGDKPAEVFIEGQATFSANKARLVASILLAAVSTVDELNRAKKRGA